jgi:transcriptional regulator with XRE-family HTH domain
MAKRYESVEQMVADLPVASDFKKEVAQQISERRIATTLFAMRNARGFTQEEVAKQLGCRQPTVSKIERGPDDAIRIGEIRAYAKLMKCDVEIAFVPQSMSIVDRVKYHAFQIKRLLDKLGKLSKTDDKLISGVRKFYYEAAANLLKIVIDAEKKLPKKKGRPPKICITEYDATGDPESEDSETKELMAECSAG